MRIIAGKYKGLVLKTFEADNIRPTADRAREGIFNKLQFIIKDSSVLDLFGGTGAISLEFVSRGAKKVITCDNDNRSIKLIQENFAKAKVKPELLIGDYMDILSKMENSFDIIFLDPPFATNYGELAIETIINKNLLNDNGIIVFEHSSEKIVDYPENIHLLDSKKYGYITVDYLQVNRD